MLSLLTTLKSIETALTYYVHPHAHSNVSAANIENLKQENCYCLTGETLKERQLEVQGLASK